MFRHSTLTVIGNATLEQVKALRELGTSEDKAKMYSKEQAARRIRDLMRRKDGERTPPKKNDGKQIARNRLLKSTTIWPRLTSLVERNSEKCWIAVAFFGTGAAAQLPLKGGSKLAVNASEETVKTGLTNPHELEKLLKRGVALYTNGKLHAKVFVFPDRAIIGSTNASRHSANHLIEAAIEVGDRGTVIACRQFARFLCQSPPIGPKHLETLKTLYQPPSFDRVSDAAEGPGNAAGTSDYWIVRVEHTDYDRDDLAAEARGTPAAEEQLAAGYSVDTFCTRGDVFGRRVKTNDIATQIVSEDGEPVAYPPSRVLIAEPYTKSDGSEWRMVFVETSDDKEPKSLDSVIWKLKKLKYPNCEFLRSIQTARRIRDRRLAELFANVWV